MPQERSSQSARYVTSSFCISLISTSCYTFKDETWRKPSGLWFQMMDECKKRRAISSFYHHFSLQRHSVISAISVSHVGMSLFVPCWVYFSCTFSFQLMLMFKSRRKKEKSFVPLYPAFQLCSLLLVIFAMTTSKTTFIYLFIYLSILLSLFNPLLVTAFSVFLQIYVFLSAVFVHKSTYQEFQVKVLSQTH